MFTRSSSMHMRQAVIRKDRANLRGRGTSALDEPMLIDRVAARDRLAFEALYRNYYPRLWRFLERVTGRPQLIEEIVNDTMLVVWRKAATYNLRSQVSTWIFGIAWRRALKAMKRADEPVAFEADDQPDEYGEGPEAIAAAREMRSSIARALRTLTPDHRAVMELTYYEGRSCAEIAEIMGCPLNTVKTRMFHARRHLRSTLANNIGDAPP